MTQFIALTVSQLFEPAQLDLAVATIYAAPATPTGVCLGGGKVRFTNITGGSVTITAYAVPAKGSASQSNAFMLAEPLAANSHVDVDLPQLGPGDSFQAVAGAAASINCFALAGAVTS